MRVTFITPPSDLSGGQRVIATYADLLQRRGHRVVVVAAPHSRPTTREVVRSLLRNRRWPERSDSSHFDRVAVERRTLDRPRPVTDADVPDADVVIATWWETAEWVTALAPSKGAKVYFLQHHEVFEYVPAERVEATWRMPFHKITISKWLVDLARERYGDNSVDLVHNSVDLELFHAPRRGKQSVPTVGMLYSSHSIKGCDVSLRALADVAKKIPEARLVAFGNQALDPKLPLPQGTKYWRAPQQELIRDIYSQCDVWLCGSRTEGFHLPPLEAMACRCPVVSTRVGGPVDIIDEGVNGYLVDVGDSGRLSDRLVQVLRASEQRWTGMSDAAHATATKYTWEHATDLFERALKAAVEEAPRGGS